MDDRTVLVIGAGVGGLTAATLARFLLETFVGANLDIPTADVTHLVGCWLTVLTSCEERSFAEHEPVSAWEFVPADQLSEPARKYLVEGLTKQLVACKARTISARTCLSTGLLLLLGMVGEAADRLLDGPTNEVWFHPWVAHLDGMGVEFRWQTRAERLVLEDGRIAA
jgi:uncharacterized protein with NAD-binding domain and iron-sulfur cluster